MAARGTAVAACVTAGGRRVLLPAVGVLVCWGAAVLVVLVVIIVSWAAVGAGRRTVCWTSIPS